MEQKQTKHGNFFLIDPAIIDQVVDAGGTFDEVAAYVVLARFTEGKGEEAGCVTGAGVRAVMRYAHLGAAKANRAVEWLCTTNSPNTGEPFVARLGRDGPRCHPRLRLEGVNREGATPLPNIFLDVPDAPGTGLLSRIITSAGTVRVKGARQTKQFVRLAALRMLITMYANLDIARLGGVDPAIVTFGSAEPAIVTDDGLTAITVDLPDADATPASLIQAAVATLRRSGAVNLHLAVLDEDGEATYTIAAFGPAREWLPQAHRLIDKDAQEMWDRKTGEFLLPQGLKYRAPLEDDEQVAVIACPAMLPMTPEVEAHKISFMQRTARRIALLV